MRLAIAALLMLTTDAVAGKCASGSMAPAVLTARDAELPADGGVLVGLLPLLDTDMLDDGGSSQSANQPSWRFTPDLRTELVPVRVVLAPGLVVYQPPVGTTGSLVLQSKDKKTANLKVSFTDATPALLPAPAATAVIAKRTTSRGVRGGSYVSHDIATFRTKPPAGAFALVVLGVTKTEKVARSWGFIDAGSKQHLVAGTAGRCEPSVPGETVSMPGDKVVLAWVDHQGRLSKLSRVYTVQRGR